MIRIRTLESLLAACAVALVVELVPAVVCAQVTETARAGRPLLVVDGVVLQGGTPADQDAVLRILRPAIESIEILKGFAAAERFGAAAADGAIVIQLKPDFDWEPRAARDTVMPTPRDPQAPAPLFVVDGVILPAAVLPALAPQDIERIEVIKGAAAVEQFGERGRAGVIQVTMRPRQRGP